MDGSEVYGQRVKCWRVSLKVSLEQCMSVSGSRSLARYLDRENFDRRPPLGWKPVLMLMQMPLATYMQRSGGYPPNGMSHTEARFIFNIE